MQHAIALIAFLLSCLAAPVIADVKGPSGKVIDCYCTDKGGSRVELGEMRCLNVDGRQFMAQCQMSLNVPMWREVQANCLSANLQRAAPHKTARRQSVSAAALPRL